MLFSIWNTAVIAIFALVAGLWLGRSVKWMADETEERVKSQEESEAEEPLRQGERRIPLGWVISSPISGKLHPFHEGGRCGVLIQPAENALYAPAEGRIVRLFPMGRAMIIETDFGKEIMVRVGNGGDELCSPYYRSRVVQNEVVGRGKLLLEFDREGLESLGVDAVVYVSVETPPGDRNAVVTGKDYVKTGEELIWG